MNCVRPPLLKKPSRGFAWACAACSRAQERKLEARHTPSLLDSHLEGDEEELWDGGRVVFFAFAIFANIIGIAFYEEINIST